MKGTLIVYPDVQWATPKTFKELESAGFVYKFHNFTIDDTDVDSISAVIGQVRTSSNTFDHWKTLFISNEGQAEPL